MMRRQIIIALAWFVSSVAWVASAQSSADDEVLQFVDEGMIDLGEVPAGTTEVRVRVKNATSQRVFLDKVSGSCTCMDIDIEDRPLNPGEIRECVVAINVQPGNRKSAALRFDIRRPVVRTRVQMISYTGVAQDKLEFTIDPPDIRLPPDGIQLVTVDCEWKSMQDIVAADVILLRVLNSRGIKVLGNEELERSARRMKTRFRIELNATSLASVRGALSFEAGVPVRVNTLRNIQVEVAESLAVEPANIMLGAAPNPRSANNVRLDLAAGWEIKSLKSPDWISAKITDGNLNVHMHKSPPFRSGVAFVEVVAAGYGKEVTRRLRCVVDLEER